MPQSAPALVGPATVRAGYEHVFNTLKLNVGFAVTLAGVAVATGDIVAADQDGVVVVPFDRIDAVVARLAAVREAEARLDAQVRAGLKGLPGLSTSAPLTPARPQSCRTWRWTRPCP